MFGVGLAHSKLSKPYGLPSPEAVSLLLLSNESIPPCDESSPDKAAVSAYKALETLYIGVIEYSFKYIRRSVNPDTSREPSRNLLPLVDFKRVLSKEATCDFFIQAMLDVYRSFICIVDRLLAIVERSMEEVRTERNFDATLTQQLQEVNAHVRRSAESSIKVGRAAEKITHESGYLLKSVVIMHCMHLIWWIFSTKAYKN